MSREKRAESCLNDSQSLPLNAQSPLLKAQSSELIAFFATFARYYFVGLWKFYTFVNWIGKQIKKGGNDEFSILYLEYWINYVSLQD